MTNVMSDTERKLVAKQLRGQVHELLQKLEQIDPGGAFSKDPKAIHAPDGGPVSQAAPLIRPVMVRTVHVKRKFDGVKCHIRAKDFDPEIHESLEKKSSRVRIEKEEAPETTPKVSKFTKAQLAQMPLEALQSLPEVEAMKNAPPKKEDLIEAILVKREEIEKG